MDLDDSYIVSASYDNHARIWDRRSGTCLHVLSAHTNRIYTVKIYGDMVLTSALDCKVSVWELATGRIRHILGGERAFVFCEL